LAQHFRYILKQKDMDNNSPDRNQPADEGRNNDPHTRDRSGIQPGVQTISGGENDESNQQLTKTAADDFDTTDQNYGKDADLTYDDVGDEISDGEAG
jgi:hypothetical protein